MTYQFTGPVTYDYRPFQIIPPTRLVAVIPYGRTVWCDSAGVWHDKYAPSLEDLAGATVIYAGGRDYTVDAAAAQALQVAGYGAGLTPPYPVAVVGIAIVGYSYTA